MSDDLEIEVVFKCKCGGPLAEYVSCNVIGTICLQCKEKQATVCVLCDKALTTQIETNRGFHKSCMDAEFEG